MSTYNTVKHNLAGNFNIFVWCLEINLHECKTEGIVCDDDDGDFS